jgi:hypothetical protein
VRFTTHGREINFEARWGKGGFLGTRGRGRKRLPGPCRAALAPRIVQGTERGAAVDVMNRIRWEVQWHPASGAMIRRLVITSRGVRRLVFALGIASWVVVAGGLWAGLDGFLTRFAIDSARRQNTKLRAQQEALREQASDLAGRLFEGVDRGHRVGRLADTPGRAWESQSLRLSAKDAGTDAILAWLSEPGVQLEALGNELVVGRVETGAKPASAPAPVNKGWASVRGEPALYVADMGSARRQEAAPTTR